MVTGFDRIVIAVPSLADATEDYASLLGQAPALQPETIEPTALLPLANTTLEIVQRSVDRARIEGLVFRNEESNEPATPIENSLGLTLSQSSGDNTLTWRNAHPATMLTDIAVDHVVLRTDYADGAIDLFRDQLGIRLALDQEVPEWGGRMLFFRTGKLTLEVLAPLPGEKPVGDSRFWGITYQCVDIDRMTAQLQQRGVACSEVRGGRKPGTRVATVKSHCLELPTLLIEPAPR